MKKTIQSTKDYDPPLTGYARKWMKCKTCGNVYAYDYVPYSLSNPIITVPCGHGACERDYGLVEVTEDEADYYFKLRAMVPEERKAIEEEIRAEAREGILAKMKEKFPEAFAQAEREVAEERRKKRKR